MPYFFIRFQTREIECWTMAPIHDIFSLIFKIKTAIYHGLKLVR